MEKSEKWVEAEPSIQSPFQKESIGTSGQKLHKTDIKVSRSVQFCLKVH